MLVETAQEMALGQTRVLAHYVPSKLDKITIERELRNLVAGLGYRTEFLEIRDPDYNHHIWMLWHEVKVNIAPFKWHQDDMGRQSCILLWSNNQPTEIRSREHPGHTLILQPYDVVLVDNHACEHRAQNIEPKERWFARITIIRRERNPNGYHTQAQPW